MGDSNATLALQVLSGYHEVQLTIGKLIEARQRSYGNFGSWMARQTKRLTDDERRTALIALAADVGLANLVKRVPNVLGDAKAIRDRLAHSMAVHVGDNEVRGFKDGDMYGVTTAELEATAWRLFWVLEHVLHIAEVAGLSPANPFNIVRSSGIPLIDAPPTAKPPEGAIADPSRIPRVELRIAQMKDRNRQWVDPERGRRAEPSGDDYS